MRVSRRRFLGSAAAGSTAYLAGCGGPAGASLLDAGSPCPLPAAATPPALDYPAPSYFDQISADLDAAGIGTPVVLVDMDRVDANIDAIVAAIPPGSRYRIVEKSLPSLDLLSYVSRRSRSDHFLVLHLPFLAPLLTAFPSAEVLVGKAHVTSAVESFLAAQPATELPAIAARVIFVADGAARLSELAALATRLGVTLRLVIELDVGLRRSGITTTDELTAMLTMLRGATSVELAGLLGYDGHVAFTPGGTLAAVNAAWTEATAIYRSFVDVLQTQFSDLLTPDLIFNSGGSSTFPMYGTPGTTPVNDVAAGGGVLRPGDYPDHVISALQPAIFIATPVLRQFAMPRLPFFSEAQSARLFAGVQGLTIHGGGWPALWTHPRGIQPAPFVSDAADPAMVPNQGMVIAPGDTPIEPGDWVFYHPRQSDALFQFEQIHLVRGARLRGETMAAYPRRY